MTTATLDFNQPTLFKDGRFSRQDTSSTPALRTAGPSSASASRGRADRTLDHVLSAAWEGLAAHHSVTCPICSGSMVPRYGSGAKPVGGRCKRCGSTLG
jgi:hypothetical protein